MHKTPMTLQGAAQLKEELHRLKTIDRQQVIKAIAEARAHGDLRENAEYAAAKERQGFIEGRIQEIEFKLSQAQIINVADIPYSGKVIFGATVSLKNLDTEEEMQYQIVGEDEADIKQGKIAVTAPIARAAIGKYTGDSFSVNTPNGEVAYEITEVDYR